MPPNPALRALGLSPTDRAVILHVDDIGMGQASIAAFAELWELGTVSSGAVMVPCPWFREAVAWASAHPEADLGVHATLNAEWDGYRWGPLSTRDPASGLLDDQGYFPNDQAPIWEGADETAVWAEVGAQIRRAQAAGIDLTHVDTHMLTLSHPRFMPGYARMLGDLGLPGLLPRRYRDYLSQYAFIGVAEGEAVDTLLAALEGDGLPLLDGVEAMPLDDPTDNIGYAMRLLDGLQPGTINLVLLHPAVDTPELRAMCRDWPSRVANYEAFRSDEFRAYLRDSDLQVIGYRPLRDAQRQRMSAVA